jgi:heat-inducible transcriptional repressor
VKIFIGSDTSAFSHIGWSAVLAPYRGADNGVVGAVGVIGPSYLNYKRIVPLVDYTADVVSRLLSEGGTVQSITAQALSGKA